MRVFAAALTGFVLYGALSGAAVVHPAMDKLRFLQHGKPRAGTRITLTTAELRQWVRDEAPAWSALGATNLRFTLGTGRATGYADVDFLKARKATTGQDAGWLLRNLFSGRRPVVVTARFSSAGGKGRVDIERLTVNGIALEGPALDFLIADIVRPNFPEARVAEWFAMDYRVDHFTVAPGGVTIVIGK